MFVKKTRLSSVPRRRGIYRTCLPENPMQLGREAVAIDVDEALKGPNFMNRYTRARFIALSSAAGISGALPFATQGDPAQASTTDADVSKLYFNARTEGSVTWWTAHYALETAERVRDAFMAKYPHIEVRLIRQTAQVIYGRLIEDLRSGINEVDVFASTDESHYPALKKQNVLAEFVPADLDKIPQQFQKLDPDNTYQLGCLAFVLLSYSTKKIASPPSHWADLLNPEFKNQVTLGHPAFSGYAGAWVLQMNDQYGWEYFRRLAKNNPKISRSIYDTVADIISGERAIGAGPDALSFEKKSQGNAIDVVYPGEGATLITAPVAVMKNAPHPNAARLFMNFFYSKEYSLALEHQFNYPLRSDTPSAQGIKLANVRYYVNKVDRLATGIPEVVAKWRETFNV
jgi:iron(III) transport system substrate-binding protein